MAYEATKVNLTSFKKKNDAELISFGNMLIENGKDKDFDPFRNTLDKLALDVADFEEKVLKSDNKGRIELNAKNIAREKLLATITEFAYYVTGASVYSPTIVSKSGFSANPNSGSRHNPNANLAAPFGLKMALNPKTQEYKLSFELEEPSMVVKNALEFSEDNGEAWKNGTYFSGKTYVMNNFPRRKDLLVRVKSLGRYSRESEFSIPLSVFLA